MYTVFTRTWWRENKDWADGREPHIGRSTTLQKDIETEEKARGICKRYNDTHDPGFLSRKAEYRQQ